MGGLAFLTPLFLFGAFGALIPLLLHLIRRERVAVRLLSTFRFLKISHQEVVRQQKLRRILLLLLRMAACAILAMVFARPFLSDSQNAVLAGLQPKSAAILVDTSYSMGFGNRMDLARRRAVEIARALNPGDQAVLIDFSNQAHVLKEPGADHSALESLIQTRLAPVFRGTNYTEALRLADDYVNRSGFEDRTVHLISDFQKTGWDRSAVSWKLGPGVKLRLIDVSEAADANTAITDVALSNPLTRSERTQDIVVRIKNFGDAAFRGTVKLTINDRTVDTRRVDLASQSGQAVSFRQTFQQDVNAGMVELSDDLMPVDNTFYFTVQTPPALRILCVEDRDSRRGTGGDAFYVAQALTVRQDPPITVDLRPSDALTAVTLGDYDVVVLANAGMLARSATERLKSFVDSGGGLMIGLNPNVSINVFNTSLANLAPGRIRSVWPQETRRDEYRSIADIDYQHPVFQPFAGPHNGDFGTARFFRIAQIEVDSTTAVLGSFDDGSPAFIEKNSGQGHVLMMASTFGLSWTDFPIRGVFVPFLYQVVDYLGGRFSSQNLRTKYYHLVGESVRIAGGGNAIVTTPSGDPVEVHTGPNETPLFSDTATPGLYRVESGGQTHRFAVNLDTRESDFTRLDVEEFAASVINPVTESQEAKEMRLQVDRQQNEEIERRQRLWWFLSLALLAVILGETLLASRTHR